MTGTVFGMTPNTVTIQFQANSSSPGASGTVQADTPNGWVDLGEVDELDAPTLEVTCSQPCSGSPPQGVAGQTSFMISETGFSEGGTLEICGPNGCWDEDFNGAYSFVPQR